MARYLGDLKLEECCKANPYLLLNSLKKTFSTLMLYEGVIFQIFTIFLMPFLLIKKIYRKFRIIKVAG